MGGGQWGRQSTPTHLPSLGNARVPHAVEEVTLAAARSLDKHAAGRQRLPPPLLTLAR